MKKQKITILFGGKSAEHEVSLQSAKSIYEAIDREKFEPVLLAIEKSGKWVMRDDNQFFHNADDPEKIVLAEGNIEVAMLPQSEGKIIDLQNNKVREITDVVFPVLHGTYGEDGTVQGLLKLVDIPFVGAGVLGSAVGMDKDVMKRLLNEAGLLNAKCIIVNKANVPDYSEVSEKLGMPIFVKPANLGSSVGISKVRNRDEYQQAIELALLYDNKILIEENIDGREIECSVLGNSDVQASVPGEIIVKSDFYSYETKYVNNTAFELKIPAELDSDLVENIKTIAIRSYKVLNCEGMARVDIFLRPDKSIYVNEINTIPGFTKNSMYPKLWEATGLSYTDLITNLIELAKERYTKEKSLKTDFK